MNPPFNIAIIVGLGNPGPRYEHTYHNAGALALDEIKKTMTMTMTRRGTTPLFEFERFSRDHGRGKSTTLTLVRPRCFMNESGPAVARALSFFKVPPQRLLVAHDDSDLPLGTARFAFGRGSAGHHGIASVIEALGTENFWRLRIGVRPGRGGDALGRPKAGSFVLRRMGAADRNALYRAVGGTIEKLIRNEN
jgi:PTH1 family peptidyl-tRNA hydrolase